MRCRDCPYGKYDFESRMNRYTYFYESGGNTKLLHGLTPEEVSDEIEEFIWCEKVGGKVYWAGHCSDSSDLNKKLTKDHKKKSIHKYERYLKHKQKLKRLYEMSNSMYPCPVIYTDEIWIKGRGYVENPKPYYKRWYRGKRSKYLKRLSNKRIRRYKNELYKGNQCHKLFDFWWEYS